MLNIGITRHRFLVNIPKLQTSIDLVLNKFGEIYSQQPWTIISSLAGGADHLVVQRAWLAKPTTGLIVPLESGCWITAPTVSQAANIYPFKKKSMDR
ncbi:MAG: hypothetical protein WCK35_04425 [Chloroflexota bacterium]